MHRAFFEVEEGYWLCCSKKFNIQLTNRRIPIILRMLRRGKVMDNVSEKLDTSVFPEEVRNQFIRRKRECHL